MNLAVHELEGDSQKAITYYEDPHQLLGKADYVMANPPFALCILRQLRYYIPVFQLKGAFYLSHSRESVPLTPKGFSFS